MDYRLLFEVLVLVGGYLYYTTSTPWEVMRWLVNYWHYIPWLFAAKVFLELLYHSWRLFLCYLKSFWLACKRFKVWLTPVILYDGPEKMKMSSLLQNAKMPKFQAKVYIADETGVFYFSGMGFRSGNFFFTAYHVIELARKIRLSVGDVSVELSCDAFQQVEIDLAKAIISPGDFSKLGLTSAQLNSSMLARDMASYGQIVGGATEQQSYGLVKSMQAFGYVSYSGSTLAGFSGAPYYMGNRVLGMHVGAHGDNMGYDSGYIQVIAKAGNEDSDEYWAEESEKTSMQARRGLNPDEVFVKHRGRYHLLSVDTVGKMKNVRWVEVFQVDDYENANDSKNLQGAPFVPAYKHGANLEVDLVAQSKQLNVIETVLPTQDLGQVHTELQTLMLAQPNDPLKSTLDIIIAVKHKPASSRTQNWKRAWRELRKLSVLGGMDIRDLMPPSNDPYLRWT